ncbi:hypothetical protein IMZ68_06860 [Candidatus Bathyarchaeota archaeon]|nr:hypothetical protein [Candidatus Bathyarchaeota archaeon]
MPSSALGSKDLPSAAARFCSFHFLPPAKRFSPVPNKTGQFSMDEKDDILIQPVILRCDTGGKFVENLDVESREFDCVLYSPDE